MTDTPYITDFAASGGSSNYGRSDTRPMAVQPISQERAIPESMLAHSHAALSPYAVPHQGPLDLATGDTAYRYLPAQRAAPNQNTALTFPPYGPTAPTDYALPNLAANQTNSEQLHYTTYASYIKHLTHFKAPTQFDVSIDDPPELQEWRERFFDVSKPFILSQEQFTTYYPFVDNIYSHRSTQYSNRKSYVNYYFDCRLKGRPSGKPMSKASSAQQDADSPQAQKRTRKRKRREQELCNVKIKITEYFSSTEIERAEQLYRQDHPSAPTQAFQGTQVHDLQQLIERCRNYPVDHPGYAGQKWYLVSRVAPPSATEQTTSDVEKPPDADQTNLEHQHSLSDVDRIKKNSVQRQRKIHADEERREQKRLAREQKQAEDDLEAVQPTTAQNRLQPTGRALGIINTHRGTSESGIVLYGNSLCPFTQRIWIALEVLGLGYQYIDFPEETYDTSTGKVHSAIRDTNPEGHIPFLKHGGNVIWDNSVILDYLGDTSPQKSLFGSVSASPATKSQHRQWAKFVDSEILPAFYSLLFLSAYENNLPSTTPRQTTHSRQNTQQRQEQTKRRNTRTLLSKIAALVLAFQDHIRALHSDTMSTSQTLPLTYIDLVIAPLMIRSSSIDIFTSPAQIGVWNKNETAAKLWFDWQFSLLSRDQITTTMSESKTYEAVYGGEAIRAGLIVPEERYVRVYRQRVLKILGLIDETDEATLYTDDERE